MLRTAAPLTSGGCVVGSLHTWQKSRVCLTQGVQSQLPKLRTQDLKSLRLQAKAPRKRRIRAVLESNSAPAVDDAEAASSVTKPLAVSVIIPVYNEVATIGTLVEKVGSVMQNRGGPYEVVCVDDGSTYGTARLLKAMAAEREDMRVVIFRRNFGQTAAMTAGFDLAAGQVFVTMDGDLQNDAEDIPQLVDQLVYGNQGGQAVHTGVVREDGGYDLVCGWRRKRKDNLLTRNFPSWVANILIGALTGVKLHDYGCSVPPLCRASASTVRHHPRTLGKSKYGLGRIFRVLMDLTTMCFLQRFREKPMHLMGSLGGLCVMGSIVAAVFTTCSLANMAQIWGYSMAIANAGPGFAFSVQLLIVGFQLVCLGLLAEVCVRTYFESQPRPAYRIREVATSTTR